MTEKKIIKLSQKALILISVPLAFELLFVSVLFIMVQNSERETQRAEHSRMTIVYADTLIRRLYELGMATLAQKTVGGSFFASEFDRAALQIKVDLKNLSNNIARDKKQLQTLNEITPIVDSVVATLQHGRESIDPDEQDFPMRYEGYDYKSELEPLLNELVPKIKDITDRERVLRKAHPLSEQMARRQVRLAIVVGILFNVLLAFGLALYFNRTTTRRFAVLLDNANKLGDKKPLNEPLSGGDEIGDLDKSFHEMATRLNEVERLKKEFLEMVSHDLRTPLTSIDLFLQFLLGGGYGTINERGEKAAAGASKESQRLIRLVNDILDVEKLSSGSSMPVKLAPCTVNSILVSAMESLSGVAQKADVKLELAAVKPIELFADRERLIQVVGNLGANAIKFSPKGGLVTLAAVSDDSEVEVSVTDQGRGVPDEMKELIFERFKQVKTEDATEKGGKGLGLSICKAIVEAHKGQIGVESEPGKGSRFWFRVPIDPEEVF